MEARLKIPFARPSITPDDIARVAATLESGWLTSGPQVERFEKEFAAYTGHEAALAVNSATSGLHLALLALGVGPGDKVVIPVNTFCACPQTVMHAGAEPVFCDVNERSFNLDPAKLDQILEENKGVKAVMAVHIGGLMCEMESISKICEARGVRLIEDAAHTLPGSRAGIGVGQWGDAAVFSFYATKPLCAGEGGMVVAKDSKVLAKAKSLRFHGIDRDIWDRYHNSSRSWDYDVVEEGYKYNMSEITAAIGLGQLQKIDDFWRRRQEVATRYLREINWNEDLLPPLQAQGKDAHSWHLFVIQTSERDRLADYLVSQGIGCSVHFKPLHLMTLWKREGASFPVSELMYQRILSLPIYPLMSESDVSYVCGKVNKFYETIR